MMPCRHRPLRRSRAVPPVLVEREALKEEIEAPAPHRTPVALNRIGRQVRAKQSGKGKSAFTLRLDDERHLRLRLASAVTNRSAQLLVTEALDALPANAPRGRGTGVVASRPGRKEQQGLMR